MDLFQNATSFLGGSLGTILIKWLIDKSEKSKENKRGLAKQFYTNKIAAAEKAVSLYITVLGKTTEKIKSWEAELVALADNSQTVYNFTENDRVRLLAVEYIENVIRDKFYEANVIHLYFDLLNNPDWNESHIKEIFLKNAELMGAYSELAEAAKNITDDLVTKIANYKTKLEELITIEKKRIESIKMTVAALRFAMENDFMIKNKPPITK